MPGKLKGVIPAHTAMGNRYLYVSMSLVKGDTTGVLYHLQSFEHIALSISQGFTLLQGCQHGHWPAIYCILQAADSQGRSAVGWKFWTRYGKPVSTITRWETSPHVWLLALDQ